MTHFHTNRHDAGYLSNSEPNFYADFDSAWESVKWEAESHMDYYAQGDLDEPIRGQVGTADGSRELVTARDEIDEVERQLAEMEANLADPAYRASAEAAGLAIVLEDGVAVIELEPCNLAECEAEFADD